MQFRFRLVFFVSLLAASANAQAPTWENATQLDGVEMSGLSDGQKKLILDVLRSESCTCGCGMKVAECRIKDPACSYSRGMAAMVVKQIKEGKSVQDVRASLGSLPRRQPNQILEDPVKIAIDGLPVRGSANAKLTLVEFSDFQCPFCTVAFRQTQQILAKYPRDVKLVFKQFPLSELHPQAQLAAEAALAAGAQGKFWEMHDKLFALDRHLSRERIVAAAGQIGLDMKRFNDDLTSGKYKAQVQKDVEEGLGLGVQGTPTFFFNGRKYNGPFETDVVMPLIDAEIKAPAESKKTAQVR